MSVIRPALLLVTLLLGGCASPAHQQLGAALSGLEGELTRLEEELAAMNGLHYQKAIDAPVTLRRHLKAPAPTAEGLVPVQSRLQDGPLLRYDYRLPAGMARSARARLAGRGPAGQPPHPAARLPLLRQGPWPAITRQNRRGVGPGQPLLSI